MGIDYTHAGSASYPRFADELRAVAKIFGGIKATTGNSIFTFPEGTNETLVKWFNDIYGEDFTKEETKTIWECVKEHPEIKDISYQIWDELEHLVENEESWWIF